MPGLRAGGELLSLGALWVEPCPCPCPETAEPGTGLLPAPAQAPVRATVVGGVWSPSSLRPGAGGSSHG